MNYRIRAQIGPHPLERGVAQIAERFAFAAGRRLLGPQTQTRPSNGWKHTRSDSVLRMVCVPQAIFPSDRSA